MNRTREEFFKGIAEMLTQFSEQDLKHMKVITDNEILSRRKSNTKNKILKIPEIII